MHIFTEGHLYDHIIQIVKKVEKEKNTFNTMLMSHIVVRLNQCVGAKMMTDVLSDCVSTTDKRIQYFTDPFREKKNDINQESFFAHTSLYKKFWVEQ